MTAARMGRTVHAAGSGIRRATASVRVRVAVITAVTFATVLVVASVLLLDAFERRLTNRVRDETVAAVATQAQQFAFGDTGVARAGGAPGEADLLYVARGVTMVAFPTLATRPLGGTETYAVGSGAVDGPGLTITHEPVGGTPDGREVSVAMGQFAPTQPASLPFDLTTASRLGVLDGAPKVVATVALDDQVSLAAVSSLADVRDTIDSARALLWWVVPALVLLVGALAWVVVGRALRPVHAVTRQLASIGSESLHERVPVPPVDDEVGELAHTMNSMLDRLESATLVSRQLVSDASHELRTPIAVLRTELEVARSDAGTDWSAVSVAMLNEVERLQGLVDDLLLLARASEKGMRREPVDVVDLVAQVAARRRRVPVAVDPGTIDVAAVQLEGDPAALRSAVDHLVANAARHARSQVSVRVATAGDRLVIAVEDDGNGIAEADRQRVLERFVRLDEGRARDGGGSGLGLAVAHDVAVAHGGSVTIGDADLGGARITITVPARVPLAALSAG